MAITKRAACATQTYWGRPVPGFGDADARLLVLGLAPAAHGANRTGRMFTGDRSGEWLFGALHRAGYANQSSSESIDDGLQLTGAWISGGVRCAPPANKPTPVEARHVRRPLAPPRARAPTERDGGRRPRPVRGMSRGATWSPPTRTGPRPRFGHGAEAEILTVGHLIGSYHVSQQNTFTGKLTEPMLDAVFRRVRNLTDGTGRA